MQYHTTNGQTGRQHMQKVNDHVDYSASGGEQKLKCLVGSRSSEAVEGKDALQLLFQAKRVAAVTFEPTWERRKV